MYKKPVLLATLAPSYWGNSLLLKNCYTPSFSVGAVSVCFFDLGFVSDFFRGLKRRKMAGFGEVWFKTSRK
jgi:hypothetical protein